MIATLNDLFANEALRRTLFRARFVLALSLEVEAEGEFVRAALKRTINRAIGRLRQEYDDA